MHIRLNHSFIGPKRERVEELLLVEATSLRPLTKLEADTIGEPLALFFGTAYVQMMGMNQKGEPVPMPPQEITFPIEASDRMDAFNKFEKSANDYLNFLKEESIKEQNKSDLYIPSPDEVGRFGNNLKLAD